MANTNNPHGFQPERNEAGAAIPIEYGYLDTGQTVTKGDLIYWGANGNLIIYTAQIATVAGVATEAKTTTTAVAQIGFYPVQDNIIFSAQSSGTPTTSLIGSTCDIEGGTGAMMINENATNVNIVRIVGLNARSTMGQYAELDVKFVQSKVTA